jgi:hypothetical protein
MTTEMQRETVVTTPLQADGHISIQKFRFSLSRPP